MTSIDCKFDGSEAIAVDAIYDPSNLAGKSVIITGGASGIGEVTLRAFVEAGAFVTFGDINEDLGQALVSELGKDKVAFVRCDVLTWADQLLLFKTALQVSFSKTIDVVLANAGLIRLDDLYLQDDKADEPQEPDLHVLKTNLLGVAYTTKLANFYFPKQPQGEHRDRCLILTASLSGYLDHDESPQYNSSKWGVRGLLRSMRVTGPPQGIRVNLVAPWFVATRIMSEKGKVKFIANGIEFCEIEDAAHAVLHFASTRNINGRALAVVPRSINKRGYFDLEKDDYAADDVVTSLQYKLFNRTRCNNG